MAPNSNASSTGDYRVGVYYDLEKKEIQLRFEKSAFALAYQAKNPEGRIMYDRPREVLLPVSPSMKTLRSSDKFGMVIIFRSKDDRKAWLNRCVLGDDVNTSDGEYGVWFRRAWSRDDFFKRLDYREPGPSTPVRGEGYNSPPPPPRFRQPSPQPPVFEEYEAPRSKNYFG